VRLVLLVIKVMEIMDVLNVLLEHILHPVGPVLLVPMVNGLMLEVVVAQVYPIFIFLNTHSPISL